MFGFFEKIRKNLNTLDGGVISVEFMNYQDDIRSLLAPERPKNIPPKYIESMSYFFFLSRFIKHQMNFSLIEECLEYMNYVYDQFDDNSFSSDDDLVDFDSFRRELYDRMHQSGLHTNSPNLDLSLILLQMYLHAGLDNKFLYTFLEKRDAIHSKLDWYIEGIRKGDPDSFQGDATWDQVLSLFD